MFEKHLSKIFFLLAIFVVAAALFYPFLKHPFEAANPWPEAYQVIQKSIIEQQKVPPDYVVQFGERQPSDMTYFLSHHLMIVPFKLISNTPFEINERFLSIFLTLAIFFSAFLFFTKVFGLPRGGIMAILFIFLPRNLNYYSNVNGEFLSLIVLFTALYFTFDWFYTHKKSSLAVGLILAGILPVLCLINLAIYCLLVAAYCITSWIKSKKKFKVIKESLKIYLLLGVVTIAISAVPLYLTGNLFAGASSSIGSLYSSRPQSEIDFEKKYYEEYAIYGRTFYNYPILIRDIYYISLDGSLISYVAVYFLILALLGCLTYLRSRPTNKEVLFGITLIALMLLLEGLLYSKFFNDNIYNSALRFLLYFPLPLLILAAVGLETISEHRKYIVWIFLISLVSSSFAVFKNSAYTTNDFRALYGQPYKRVQLWTKENIPDEDRIMTNEWTNGEFYVQANKLDIVESGKASASYSTYEHIYTLLSEAKAILSAKTTPEDTAKLIRKQNIKYIVLWNRPAAYELYPEGQAEIKFERMPFLEKVYSDKEDNSGYMSTASVYRVKTWQLSQYEE